MLKMSEKKKRTSLMQLFHTSGSFLLTSELLCLQLLLGAALLTLGACLLNLFAAIITLVLQQMKRVGVRAIS